MDHLEFLLDICEENMNTHKGFLREGYVQVTGFFLAQSVQETANSCQYQIYVLECFNLYSLTLVLLAFTFVDMHFPKQTDMRHSISFCELPYTL